jgi:uncharacterized protein (TIGR02147 family)
MKNVFEFLDYKLFLLSAEDSRKAYQRGFRSKLAEFIGCQSGYISHVLNGKAHLSLEQALRVAEFLSLKESERKYLLLLVERARAGTSELKSHFESELRVLKDAHLNIRERVGSSLALSESDQSTYYSSWHYLAVHVLSSLAEYNDAKSIAHALQIPDEVAGRVLLFLIRAGIITETKGRLKAGLTQVHLNRESPLIRQHHTNWRIAAIQSLMNEEKNDVHYSTLSTLSKADAENLKSDMIKLIEHYVATVKPSKEEVMYGFNLDFYNLVKR